MSNLRKLMTSTATNSTHDVRRHKQSPQYAIRFMLFSLLVICLTTTLHSHTAISFLERVALDQQDLPTLVTNDDIATLNDSTISESENSEPTDRLDLFLTHVAATFGASSQQYNAHKTRKNRYQRIAHYSYIARAPPASRLFTA